MNTDPCHITMNTFTCHITERHRPGRAVDYTASINMDEDCSLVCSGFNSIALAKVVMSNIANDALGATLTFTLPESDA